MERIMHITERLVEELRAANREDGRAITPTCLVVEDDPDDAELSRRALEVVGAKVEMASTGDEAIKLLRNSNNPAVPDFDIVFLDLVLRGSFAQGLEVLKFIRDKFPLLHVVVVSGHINSQMMNHLTQMQVGGYIGIITKPLHKLNVREILDKHRLTPAYA